MIPTLHRLSVRAKLILSFAIIALVSTLAFNIAFYTVGQRNTIAQINRSNQRSLEILAANLAREQLEPAVIYASEMVINPTTFPDIHQLFYKPSEITPVRLQWMQSVLRGFSYHDMSLFSDVMIYSGDRNLTIANTNGVTYLNRNDKKHPGDLWWLEAAQGGASAWLYGNINPSIDQAGLIYVYLSPSPVSGSGAINALAFQFSQSALMRFVDSQKNPDSAYFLFTRDGAPLYGSLDALADFLDADTLPALLSGALPEEGAAVQGGKSILHAAHTDIGGLTLLSITPMDLLYQEADALGAAFRMIGLMTFVAGLLLSYYLTNRLYRPLKEIRTAAPDAAIPEAQGLNEYEYLDAVLKNLRARAAELEETLRQHQPLLRNARLDSLLSENPREDASDPSQLRQVGLALDMPLLRLARVLVPESLAEALPAKDVESIIFSIMSMAEDLSDPRQYRLYATQNHARGFTLLINYHAGGIDGEIQLRSLADALRAYGLHTFNVRVLCLFSSPVRSPALLYQLSAELSEMQQYLFFMWDRPTLLAEDIPALLGNAEELPPALWDGLVRALRRRDTQGAEAAAQRMADAFKTGRYPQDLCRQAILSALRQVADENPGEPELFARLHEAFLRCDSADGLAPALLEHLSPQAAPEADDTRSRQLARKAAEAIRASAHKGVGLEALAARLHISAGYLGRLFREEWGVSPSEYANLQRLEMSLPLLENTTLRIDAIAAQVGFGSTAYYIKKFREQYGVTPKNYRVRHMAEE